MKPTTTKANCVYGNLREYFKSSIGLRHNFTNTYPSNFFVTNNRTNCNNVFTDSYFYCGLSKYRNHKYISTGNIKFRLYRNDLHVYTEIAGKEHLIISDLDKYYPSELEPYHYIDIYRDNLMIKLIEEIQTWLSR